MSALRHHLRFWVTTWLVFQVVSLSALVPRDCCAAHRIATEKQRTCHEEAAAATRETADGDHCPMPGMAGEACPMHGTAHDGHQSPARRCTMQGTCAGPMAALFVIISNHGVLTEPLQLAHDLTVAVAPNPAREELVSRFSSPASPPPRA
jgi:hypothetical protein